MASWSGKRPQLWVPLLALTAAALLVLLLGPVAWWATPSKHLTGKDKTDALNSTRQIVLAGVGGIVLLTGAVFTVRTFALTRRGQITDRYAKAMAQLASDKLTERLGGIYALEHVMIESERDHNTVVEVLAAFIRERAPIADSATADEPVEDEPPWAGPASGGTRPPTDVQAALTVINRRPHRPEREPIDLRRTDLRGADLGGAELRAANLIESHLQGADLTRALLEDALLIDANLQRADLMFAELKGASLTGAQLQRASLAGAQLQGAHLELARLQHADLTDAQLQGAILYSAQLHGAEMSHAQFQGTRLDVGQLDEVQRKSVRLGEPGPPGHAAV